MTSGFIDRPAAWIAAAFIADAPSNDRAASVFRWGRLAR